MEFFFVQYLFSFILFIAFFLIIFENKTFYNLI